MGWECSVYGGEERRIKVLWWGKLRGRDHLEDPGVDEKIILRCIFRKWDGAQDWDRWRAFVNAVMNIRFP
jgi:hypothetical protein